MTFVLALAFASSQILVNLVVATIPGPDDCSAFGLFNIFAVFTQNQNMLARGSCAGTLIVNWNLE